MITHSANCQRICERIPKTEKNRTLRHVPVGIDQHQLSTPRQSLTRHHQPREKSRYHWWRQLSDCHFETPSQPQRVSCTCNCCGQKARIGPCLAICRLVSLLFRSHLRHTPRNDLVFVWTNGTIGPDVHHIRHDVWEGAARVVLPFAVMVED